MYGELKDSEIQYKEKFGIEEYVRQGIPFWSQKNAYVPPSVLCVPHNAYQTTGSTSGFFAELFILWDVSVQSDSLIWLSVGRWRNLGETCLVCLVNWKSFHVVEIISHVTSMSVPQPTHTFMYFFNINVSCRAHQIPEGRMLMIYNAVFRHFHIFWGCNIAIMNLMQILTSSVLTILFFRSIMSYDPCNAWDFSYSFNVMLAQLESVLVPLRCFKNLRQY